MMDKEPLHFVGRRGVTIVGESFGPDDGWPVLFLHGGGQTRHAWRRVAERVAADGWRAVTVDLRGHGESDWASDGDYSFDSFRADCEVVATSLGRPVLVGASLVGKAALLCAGDDPTSVSGLVLVDITHKVNPVGKDRILSFMNGAMGGFDTLEEASDAIARYTPHRERRRDLEGLTKVLRHRDGRWYWHWDPVTVRVIPAEEETEDYVTSFHRAMSRIAVPTMLVRGSLSDVVSDDGVDDLVARIPGTTVVTVPDATHMIAGDRNDAFGDAIVSFLRDQVSTGEQG